MKNIKFLFDQFVTITAFIVIVLGIIHLFTEDGYISSNSLIQIAGCGLLSTLPSVVYISKNEYSTKEYVIRAIIHYILLNIVVLSFGYVFNYYSTFNDGMIVFITILIVFICVHLSQIIFNKSEANKINKVLEDISDKE